MGQYKPAQIKTEKIVLVIVSTYGEGDPPDSAREVYDYLFSKRAPMLPDLNYAVLALGDSSYEFFCKTGIDFDQRLHQLGAKRLLSRVDCDVDFESMTEKWIDDVHNQLSTQVRQTHSHDMAVTAQRPQTNVPSHTRKNPFPATLLENIRLNGRGSTKETRH